LHSILPIIQVGDPVSDFQTGEIGGGNKRGGGGGGRTLEPYPRDRIAGIVATASAQNSNRDVAVHRRSMILIQRFSQVFNDICLSFYKIKGKQRGMGGGGGGGGGGGEGERAKESNTGKG